MKKQNGKLFGNILICIGLALIVIVFLNITFFAQTASDTKVTSLVIGDLVLEDITLVSSETAEIGIVDLVIGNIMKLLTMPIILTVIFIMVRFSIENERGNEKRDGFGELLNFIGPYISILGVPALLPIYQKMCINYTNLAIYALGNGFITVGILKSLGIYQRGFQHVMTGMMRKISRTLLNETDWVRAGSQDYPMEVFPVRYIPHDLESVNMDNDQKSLGSVLKKFYKKNTDKKQHVLILMGGFGTGKTTALLHSILKREKSLHHIYSMPVYVNLKEYFSEEMVKSIIGGKLGKEDLQSLRDEFIGVKRDAALDADDLCRTKSRAFSLMHENRQLVYVFDGLNAVVGRISDDTNKKQNVYNVVSFLYEIADGNNCIFSFSPMPDELDFATLQIDNALRNYEIYLIKGVKLSIPKKAALRRKFTRDNAEYLTKRVALYRMYINNKDDYVSDKADSENGDSGEKSGKESNDYNRLTEYNLLEKYVKQRIRDCYILNDDRDKCEKKFDELMEYLIKTPDKLSPYRAFECKDVQSSDMEMLVKTGLLSKTRGYDAASRKKASCDEPVNDKTVLSADSDRYLFEHVLILEFLLAKSIKRELNEKNFNKNMIKNVLLKFGDYSYIKDALKMLIADLMTESNGKVEKLFEKYVSGIEESEGDKEKVENNLIRLKGIAFMMENLGCAYASFLVFSKKDDSREKLKKALNACKDLNIKALILPLCGDNQVEESDSSIVEKVSNLPVFARKIKRNFFKIFEDSTHKYYIEEYVAEIRKSKKEIEKVPGCKAEVTKKQIKSRVLDINISTALYVIFAGLLFIQIGITFSQLVGGTGLLADFIGVDSLLWVLLTKIIGMVLCLCSFRAWTRQLSCNTEEYGWGLGNASAELSIEEFLSLLRIRNVKKDASDNEFILVEDWFRNRPSIIMMLVWTLTCLWMPDMVGYSPVARWAVYAIIFVSFFSLFPFGSYRFIFSKENKEKRKVSLIALALLGIVFGFIPITVSSLYFMNIRLQFFIITVFAAVLFCILFVCSLFAMRKSRSEDSKTIREIVAKIENDSPCNISDKFNGLTSSGQLQLIERLIVAGYFDIKKDKPGIADNSLIKNGSNIVIEVDAIKSDAVFERLLQLGFYVYSDAQVTPQPGNEASLEDGKQQKTS